MYAKAYIWILASNAGCHTRDVFYGVIETNFCSRWITGIGYDYSAPKGYIPRFYKNIWQLGQGHCYGSGISLITQLNDFGNDNTSNWEEFPRIADEYTCDPNDPYFDQFIYEFRYFIDDWLKDINDLFE